LNSTSPLTDPFAVGKLSAVPGLDLPKQPCKPERDCLFFRAIDESDFKQLGFAGLSWRKSQTQGRPYVWPALSGFAWNGEKAC